MHRLRPSPPRASNLRSFFSGSIQHLAPRCPSLARIDRAKKLLAQPEGECKQSGPKDAGAKQEEAATSSFQSNRPTPSDADPSPASPTSPSNEPDGEPDTSSFTRNPESPMDASLRELWDNWKQSAKGVLRKEDAALLETVTYDEIMAPNNELLRRLAQSQFGPIMAELGVENQDPLEFLIGIVGLGLFIQFFTVGMAFYSAELLGHLDAGDAFRVACGLAIGYILRPFISVETIFAPIYNRILGLMGVPPQYTAARNFEEVSSTLNSLGILAAVLILMPKLLFGWDVEDCTQLVSPVPFGLFFADFTFMLSLYFKVLL